MKIPSFLFGLLIGTLLACPQALPNAREGGDLAVENQVDALGDPEDIKAFKLFERFADAREKRIADELIAHADGKRGQVVAGSLLAGAIMYAIKAIVTAILWTILLSLLSYLLWKYWYVLAAIIFAWLGVTWVTARAAARSR